MFVKAAAGACLLGLLSGYASATPSEEDFEKWMQVYGKSYPTAAAKAAAFAIYKESDDRIQQYNSVDDGIRYEHNEFSDLTAEAFRETRLQQRTMSPEEALSALELEDALPVDAAAPPAAVDWTAKGVVTPVKNQGSCGSCWAFSAVQNIESQWYMANEKSLTAPVALSIQQIIECDPNDYACYGGFPSGAMKYVKAAGGLAAESDYKYNIDGHTICLANQTFNETCGDGMCDDPPLTNYCDLTCKKDVKKTATISSFRKLPTDETQLAASVAQVGPVSVALDASGVWGDLHPWMQFYKSGVASPKGCSHTTLDHAVLIVGYGTDGSTPYWKVKNSWGATWGEQGYFRIARGSGMCGINTIPFTASVASQEASENIVV